MTTTSTADTVLIGCGPAGLATLVFLEQVGALQPILSTKSINKSSLVVVDPAPRNKMGGGALAQYLSPSNTSACMFAFNIFRPRDVNAPLKPEPILEQLPPIIIEKEDTASTTSTGTTTATATPLSPTSIIDLPTTISATSTPPNSTTTLLPSTILESLRDTKEAQLLIQKGIGMTRLNHLGPWFQLVTSTLMQERFNDTSKGTVMDEYKCERITVRKDKKYDVQLMKTTVDEYGNSVEQIHTITTTKIILATGGTPRSAPLWQHRYISEGLDLKLRKDNKIQKRLVMSAEEFLKGNGFAKVFKHLRQYTKGHNVKKMTSGRRIKVIVIGGSHSALSVIHTLLSGADGLIGSDGTLIDQEEQKKKKEAKKKKIIEQQMAKVIKQKSTTSSKNNKKKKTVTKKKTPKKEVGKKEKDKDKGKVQEEKETKLNNKDLNNTRENNENNEKEEDEEEDEEEDDSSEYNEVHGLLEEKRPKPNLAMYSFMKEEIVMLHRSDINLFWGNKNEAKKAGYDIDTKRMSQDVKGSCNVYTGLRGVSKSLFRKIKKGSETRVKTIKYPDVTKIENKIFHSEPDVVIYAIGYGSNVPQFIDEETTLPMDVDVDSGGQLKLTNSCQLSVTKWNAKKKIVLKNVVSTGLGSSLKTSHTDIGGEKLMKNVKADGVNIYMNQQARVISKCLWSKKQMLLWQNENQKNRRAEKRKYDANKLKKKRDKLIHGERKEMNIDKEIDTEIEKDRCVSPLPPSTTVLGSGSPRPPSTSGSPRPPPLTTTAVKDHSILLATSSSSDSDEPPLSDSGETSSIISENSHEDELATDSLGLSKPKLPPRNTTRNVNMNRNKDKDSIQQSTLIPPNLPYRHKSFSSSKRITSPIRKKPPSIVFSSGPSFPSTNRSVIHPTNFLKPNTIGLTNNLSTLRFRTLNSRTANLKESNKFNSTKVTPSFQLKGNSGGLPHI